MACKRSGVRIPVAPQKDVPDVGRRRSRSTRSIFLIGRVFRVSGACRGDLMRPKPHAMPGTSQEGPGRRRGGRSGSPLADDGTAVDQEPPRCPPSRRVWPWVPPERLSGGGRRVCGPSHFPIWRRAVWGRGVRRVWGRRWRVRGAAVPGAGAGAGAASGAAVEEGTALTGAIVRRRHGGTAARRHGGTAARRYGGASGRGGGRACGRPRRGRPAFVRVGGSRRVRRVFFPLSLPPRLAASIRHPLVGGQGRC